jgi:short-subunit dehydrogenase involved in D-alanine esterification of teichoic acids
VFLNAGVQHVMHMGKPHTVDMANLKQEIDVNYLGVVAVVNAFLPFFQKKPATSKSAFVL